MAEHDPEILKGLSDHVEEKTGKRIGGETDPKKPIAAGNEDYYKASATLGFYKNILNDKLKSKNPAAFQQYFEGLKPLRQAMKNEDINNYIQNTAYNDYLSPEEVKKTLGETDYNRYLDSIKAVNSFNVDQGRQPLYGQVEGESDVTKLNYGRRFASLAITPTYSGSTKDGSRRYNRSYVFNPTTRNVDFTEEGDLSLKPDTFK